MGEKVIVRGHVGQPHNPEPVMTVAQHERIVAGLEARLREAREILIDARLVIVSPSYSKESIDAFLAQTAEVV